MNLHPPMNYNVRFCQVWHSAVDAARNVMVQEAMKQECRYLMFIDEDVAPPPHACRQLIFHLDHNPDVAIVGGIVCHKSVPTAPMVFRGNGAGPYWDWKIGEVFEVSGIGMGCSVLRVEAFKNIPQPWFKTVNDTSPFLDGVNKAEEWTEDLYACQKLTEAGWRILADGGVLATHYNMDPPYNGVSLPPDCLPLRRVAVQKGEKKILDIGSGEAPFE